MVTLTRYLNWWERWVERTITFPSTPCSQEMLEGDDYALKTCKWSMWGNYMIVIFMSIVNGFNIFEGGIVTLAVRQLILLVNVNAFVMVWYCIPRLEEKRMFRMLLLERKHA